MRVYGSDALDYVEFDADSKTIRVRYFTGSHCVSGFDVAMADAREADAVSAEVELAAEYGVLIEL